jgi:hypothetical protein
MSFPSSSLRFFPPTRLLYVFIPPDPTDLPEPLSKRNLRISFFPRQLGTSTELAHAVRASTFFGWYSVPLVGCQVSHGHSYGRTVDIPKTFEAISFTVAFALPSTRGWNRRSRKVRGSDDSMYAPVYSSLHFVASRISTIRLSNARTLRHPSPPFSFFLSRFPSLL